MDGGEKATTGWEGDEAEGGKGWRGGGSWGLPVTIVKVKPQESRQTAVNQEEQQEKRRKEEKMEMGWAEGDERRK